ncbi:MAG: ribonuclease E/G [Lachnospiraceae bacterium]|nr:ribonuclease E/G [Lachnospiraceae bacterium]
MNDKKRIVYTTVYGRQVLVYLEGDEPLRIRVLDKEPGFPIGTVVLARVKKMMPSSGACFVDIGDDTDYFLQIPGNLNLLYFADGKKHDKVHNEDVILVQVSSEGVKMKSPGVTGNISLHSRHLVIESGKGLSFSSKIPREERDLIAVPEKICAYSSKYHIIVRTESAGITDTDVFNEEIELLYEDYERIMERVKTACLYNVLYKPEGYLQTVINDWLKYGCDELITDIPDRTDEIEQIADIRGISFCRYMDDYPLCKLYKLETCVDQCLSRKVYLKSGAFLVIEQGETLTAVDVNSGHNTKGNKEETSFNININAARELLKQLRLRNISGMILVDFINMKQDAHLEELIQETRKILKDDDVMCRYIDMTGLGLMELTRKKVYKSFIEQWKN